MTEECTYRTIDRLVSYGIACRMLPEEERVYATNLILDLLRLDAYDGKFLDTSTEVAKLMETAPDNTLQEILEPLVAYGVEKGIVEDIAQLKDIFGAKLMNALMPRPKTVIENFWKDYSESPEKATLRYFRLSKDSNYIKRNRIALDKTWEGDTKYGRLEILVSLSKPELDPKDIAAARLAKAAGYPRCALCRENEGYAGRVNAAPRQNHRIIPLELCGEPFYLQFSPYRYCHQHCIVLNRTHVPMTIDGKALQKLLEFVSLFPHYFLGSNADLPYVGGSVLSHEHFQGGVHRLPIMDAKVDSVFVKTESLEVSTLHWPLSSVRVKGRDKEEVCQMATKVLRAWRDGYRDDGASIDPGTQEEPHNTLAPLVCREGEDYVVFLMLRNNRRTEERPDGLFHTHPGKFHIKKEGIGIIDAPGLAILPPRLVAELETVRLVLLGKEKAKDHPEIEKHAEWMEELRAKYGSFQEDSSSLMIRSEVVNVFMGMLEDCGVFKQTPEGKASFARFMEYALSR